MSRSFVVVGWRSPTHGATRTLAGGGAGIVYPDTMVR